MFTIPFEEAYSTESVVLPSVTAIVGFQAGLLTAAAISSSCGRLIRNDPVKASPCTCFSRLR
jgi:hypothetical protein